MYLRLTTILALLCASAAVLAEDHAVAAKAGFLGLGVEYTYTLSDRLGFRAGINGSQYGFDGVEGDIDYDFDLVWDSLAVAVDFHPRKSPLRLSVGLLANDNSIKALSRPVADITVGGTTYAPAEVGTLTGAVGFDSTAPFAGLGWDWSRDKRRFGISFDLGLVSQGAPRVTLIADGPLLGDPAFAADLEAERVELEESLDDFDLLPCATLGFVFRF